MTSAKYLPFDEKRIPGIRCGNCIDSRSLKFDSISAIRALGMEATENSSFQENCDIMKMETIAIEHNECSSQSHEKKLFVFWELNKVKWKWKNINTYHSFSSFFFSFFFNLSIILSFSISFSLCRYRCRCRSSAHILWNSILGWMKLKENK